LAGHDNRGTRNSLRTETLVLWLIWPDWSLLGTPATLILLYRFDIHPGHRPKGPG
jgi:hypothetical protein